MIHVNIYANRNRLTDTENKHVVTKGKGRLGNCRRPGSGRRRESWMWRGPRRGSWCRKRAPEESGDPGAAVP